VNDSPSEDKLLFEKITQKNTLAFDTLFRKYYARLCRFAITYLKEEEMAEECVQEVFIKIWEQSDHLQIEGAVISYLFAATKNTALNLIKKESTRQKYESAYEEQNPSADVNISEIENEKVASLVTSAVNKLPGKCREIFMLSKDDGLTYEEIADYLKISKKTVENQMGIAFKKLREILKPKISLLFE
jgi:RNA polymerase sigma-70 factor, ECF subfamily